MLAGKLLAWATGARTPASASRRSGIRGKRWKEAAGLRGRNCRKSPEELASFRRTFLTNRLPLKNSHFKSIDYRRARQLARGLPYLLAKDPKRASSIPRDGSPPTKEGAAAPHRILGQADAVTWAPKRARQAP
jgi:hypothetical protein